jgi:hypothetical protein
MLKLEEAANLIFLKNKLTSQMVVKKRVTVAQK